MSERKVFQKTLKSLKKNCKSRKKWGSFLANKYESMQVGSVVLTNTWDISKIQFEGLRGFWFFKRGSPTTFVAVTCDRHSVRLSIKVMVLKPPIVTKITDQRDSSLCLRSRNDWSIIAEGNQVVKVWEIVFTGMFWFIMLLANFKVVVSRDRNTNTGIEYTCPPLHL